MDLDKNKQVERSIIKKFRKTIWRPFITALKQYNLIEQGDKIAVCISGGKDSFLLAKCMQELKRHGKFDFELIFLAMDPGFNEINRQALEDNAKLLDIELTIFETDIFDIVEQVEENPCYLCARMRRGYLYANAQKHGCNKIALGHHFDDVIETVLLNMFYGGEIKTMMPKLSSKSFAGMELIRPLYHVKEEHILAFKKYNDLQFLNCACRFVEYCAINAATDMGSKRNEMKLLIKNLRKISPVIDKSIFTSVENINLDAVVGYRKGGRRYSFLDKAD